MVVENFKLSLKTYRELKGILPVYALDKAKQDFAATTEVNILRW